MNQSQKKEAVKKIKEEIKTLKACPFCGKIPIIEYRVEAKHSERGSLGHFAKRLPCCEVMGSGKVDLFFCNDFKPANYELWYKMVHWLVYYWNERRG